MLVRLWNFKNGGSLNARFLPKNQHAQRKLFWNNPVMNYGLSKSAKIVLSKSIFYVKNRRNFFKKKSFKNINLGEHFLFKPFFSRLNFWTTLLSKIRSKFCRPHTMSIHKIQQFHLTTVDFWAKTLLLRTHQARNSMT